MRTLREVRAEQLINRQPAVLHAVRATNLQKHRQPAVPPTSRKKNRQPAEVRAEQEINKKKSSLLRSYLSKQQILRP